MLTRIRKAADEARALVRLHQLPEQVQVAIRAVRRRRLTYLSTGKLVRLAELCLEHEDKGVPGRIVETGCALGGSAIVMTAAKARSRQLYLYDTFSMIPPPTEDDGADVHARYEIIRSGKSRGIGGDPYYGYQENLYQKVQDSFRDLGYPVSENSVTLHKGLLQDTLEIDGAVSLAHIDVDWFDPVRVSLERIEPHLSAGGSIVLDDYFDWSGCREATDHYFASSRSRVHMERFSGALCVRKSR